MAANLGTAFGQVVIGSNTKGIAAAQKSLMGFAKGGTIAVGAVGLAFGAAIGSAVKSAASFEQQLADLSSVARPTGQELNALREQALDLGADTKFSAQEAALGQTELAKAGLSTADILGGGLQGALSLAAAGDLELADASSIAANAMNLFGIAGSEVESVADALATAANVTTGDVSDFGQALTQGGAAAKLAGLDMTQTVSILEALADAGVKGSDAGTSMKASLLQLLNPTAKQSKLAKELGINWLDQNGAMKDGAGLSAEVTRATKNMSKAERTKTLAVLAGTDGLRTLAALYEAGPSKMRAYERGLKETGTAAETARIKQGTLEGQLEQLGGAIDTIKIRVGSALIPALTTGATATADWLSALGDSEELDGFADGIVDGFSMAGSAAQDAWAMLQPLVTQIGDIGADAFSALGAAATGAAPVILIFGEALVVVAGGVLSVVAPIASLTNTLMQVPGVAQAATVAIIALGVAMAGVKVASFGAAAAGGMMRLGTAAVASAANVGRMAAAISTVKAVSPLAGAALGAIASPAGLAAIAIAGVGFAAYAIATGMSSGTSAAERMAVALQSISGAARDADGALKALNGATLDLREASLQEEAALLRRRAARNAVTAATKGMTSAERTAFLATDKGRSLTNQAAQADVDYARARGRSADASKKTRAEALNAVGAFAKMAGAIDDNTSKSVKEIAAVRRLGPALGIPASASKELTANYKKLDAAGASASEKFNLIRSAAGRAAEQLEKAGKPAAAKELKKIASLDNRGIVDFGNALADLESKGQKGPKAVKKALDGIKPPKKMKLDADDNITPKTDAALKNLKKLTPPDPIPLEADDQASDKVTSLDRLVRTLDGKTATVTLRELTIKETRTVTTTGGGGGGGGGAGGGGGPKKSDERSTSQPWKKQADEAGAALNRSMETAFDALKQGFDQLYSERVTREKALAAMDKHHQGEAAKREMDTAKTRVANAEKAARNAKKEDKAAANDAVKDAQRAVAQLRKDRRIAREEAADLRPLQAQINQITIAESALSDLEGALSDVSSRITDALQRSFDGVMKGLDNGLQTEMDGIDSTLTGSLSYIDDHLKGLLDTIDAGLKGTLAGIDAALKSTMAAIDSSVEALRVKAIDAATESARLARQQRDDARKLAELQGAAGAADTRVSRLQGVLAGARTDSERQAAKDLLDAALADQRTAAEALADFQEDQRLAQLAAEKESLEAILQTRRDAAQQKHDDDVKAAEDAAQVQRDHWTTWAEGERAAAETRASIDRAAAQTLYDQRRAAAEAEFVAKQAETQRELGNLREQLRTGEITHKQALERLAAIYGDPTINKAVTAAGETLGLDFARGMQRSQKAVEKAAGKLAGIVKKYLPQSPAEKGPLAYDQRLPGMAIAQGLASGMASQRRLVESEATRMAAAAARAGVGMSPGAWAGGPAGNTLTQHVDVHVANPVEDARAVAARMSYEARMAGGRYT